MSGVLTKKFGRMCQADSTSSAPYSSSSAFSLRQVKYV